MLAEEAQTASDQSLRASARNALKRTQSLKGRRLLLVDIKVRPGDKLALVLKRVLQSVIGLRGRETRRSRPSTTGVVLQGKGSEELRSGTYEPEDRIC